MKELSFSKAFKPAYHDFKPKPEELKIFNHALEEFIKNTDDAESEAHNVKPIIDFLKQIAYGDDKYKVNTYGNVDIAILEYGTPKVIIEVKKPVGNKTEMVTAKDLNKKALHESLLYYMREIDPPKKRNKRPNLAIGHIIITNSKEWFIIDAVEINNIAKHLEIKKAYRGIIKDKNYSKITTDAFYDEAKYIIEKYKLLKNTKVVYINFEKKYSPVELQDIYKLFTPRHLLKNYGSNDSNTLNRKFYEELLHILGLKEKPSKGKKLIQRKPEGERDDGSLLENTILKLQTEQSISDEHELFEIALELNITWLNRILFLKLLEAKLDSIYNQKYKKFLTTGIVKDFDILNTLFFEVLAIKINERSSLSIKEFKKIPYLNSSLFEPTKLERKYLRISNLKDNIKLKVFSSTKITEPPKELNSLEYLLKFLNAYNFSSDEAREFDEGNDSLINSAVLGLIFEKINGYKDGSFFTPSFVTTYMSRESIRRKVVDKFNGAYEINAENIDEIYSYLKGSKLHYKEKDIKNSNDIINQITIIDPAVGSGHFLVSALNELLVIKSELKLFFGFDYTITVEDDELYIVDEVRSVFFKYCVSENGKFSSEIQKFQEKIFHEKQKIIENQLFGVDINPNSVKITRLRLWIELLKNSYYENGELVTLPNIDINIKCGNSLISKFPLRDADAKNKLLKDKLNEYKELVKNYLGEKNKASKESIKQKINNIKNTFREELNEFSPVLVKFKEALKKYVGTYRYDGLSEELILIAVKNNHGLQAGFFDDDKIIKKAKAKNKEKILQGLNKMHQTIKGYENNKIYEDSFEWRFEFPEVLNEDGDFIGFDIVIGNPPYGAKLDGKTKTFYKAKYENVHMRTIDTFNYFISMSSGLLSKNAILSFIVPSNLLYQNEYEKTRGLLINDYMLLKVINIGDDVFEDANVPTCIIEYKNHKTKSNYNFEYADIRNSGEKQKEFEALNFEYYDKKSVLQIPTYTFGINPKTVKLIEKIKNKSYLIDDIALEVASGISTGGDKLFRVSQDSIDKNKLEEDILQKVLVGREINKYEINDTNHKLIYTTKKIEIEEYKNILKYLDDFKEKLSNKRETKKGTLPWWCLHWSRYKELFTEDKILIRQTADSIITAFDDKKYFALDSLLIFKINQNFDIDYKFATAILNSKLTTFIYKNYTGEDGRVFAQVKPKNIRKLYIPKVDKDVQNEFVKIVGKIIEFKKQDIDTLELEDKIDEKVYELFGLTGEEINIIDPERKNSINQT